VPIWGLNVKDKRVFGESLGVLMAGLVLVGSDGHDPHEFEQ